MNASNTNCWLCDLGQVINLSVPLFPCICKMVLVVVGLLWSSQEACILNPQLGALHQGVHTRARPYLQYVPASVLQLASRSPPKRNFFFWLHLRWEALPTARATFPKPSPGCWVCYPDQACLFWSHTLSERILHLMRWEQLGRENDFVYGLSLVPG